MPSVLTGCDMADEQLYMTLEKMASAEFEERNSLFIGHAGPIRDEQEAMAFIKQKQREYADATHNVWAYLLKGGIVARYSDDGEPQGTAGVPVLECMRKSGATDMVVVVTRYFGGILLGAGGLVRAYSHAARIALDAAHIITYHKYGEYCMTCSYSDYQKFNLLLPKMGALVDEVEYADTVKVHFAVKDEQVAPLWQRISEISNGKCVPERTGERYDYHESA